MSKKMVKTRGVIDTMIINSQSSMTAFESNRSIQEHQYQTSKPKTPQAMSIFFSIFFLYLFSE